MTFDELKQLHNINHLDNLASIFQVGIQSHNRAKKIHHRSVAMPEIQERRAKVVLPNGKRLHDYANLYINARNKMMFKINHLHEELCILRIDKRILHDPSVVIADQNASSHYCRFGSGLGGLDRIDHETVFADSWIHAGDQIAEWRHGSQMCAEVLVLNAVPPEYITGVYTSCEKTAEAVHASCPHTKITVNSKLFFR